jgi:hypothetical protein
VAARSTHGARGRPRWPVSSYWAWSCRRQGSRARAQSARSPQARPATNEAPGGAGASGDGPRERRAVGTEADHRGGKGIRQCKKKGGELGFDVSMIGISGTNIKHWKFQHNPDFRKIYRNPSASWGNHRGLHLVLNPQFGKAPSWAHTLSAWFWWWWETYLSHVIHVCIHYI